MTLTVGVPGRAELRLDHLMLDVNGTLTDRGVLLSGVRDRVAKLRPTLAVHLVSADTFGTLEQIAEILDAIAVRAGSGEDKVIGPEGASTAALRAADVVCGSIVDALDLLLEPRALAATLRS